MLIGKGVQPSHGKSFITCVVLGLGQFSLRLKHSNTVCMHECHKQTIYICKLTIDMLNVNILGRSPELQSNQMSLHN